MEETDPEKFVLVRPLSFLGRPLLQWWLMAAAETAIDDEIVDPGALLV